MTRLIIVCEGPTEHEFCMDVLAGELSKSDITVDAPLIKRSQGGIVSWDVLKRQIVRHLHERGAYVTMLVDYYGIKDSYNFPGWEEGKAITDKTKKIHFLFEKMKNDMPQEVASRFIPYIQLHEFECLLFSNIDVFRANFGKDEVDMGILQSAVNEFPNPEDINKTPNNAPSKRLLRASKNYDKVLYGSYLAIDIGIARIMEKCPLFNEWVTLLKSISRD